MKIMGPPTAARKDIEFNLPKLTPHDRFLDEMVPELWDAALFYGVDPVVMVAQSYKETGGGAFGGKVKPAFCNPCGLKNAQSLFPGVDDDDNPLAHARFPNWRVGAIAMAQHLRAYAGVYLPVDALILSPRYHFVVSANKPVASVEFLGGRWALSLTYGNEIVAIAKRLGAAV